MPVADDTAVDDRVAVLLRFRETLKAQREKFSRYLKLLDRQEKAIRTGDVDAIVQQAELETTLLREIEAVQKVLTPLEAVYVRSYPQDEDQIPPLRRAVLELRSAVLQHNRRNRELLREKLELVRTEIESLRVPGAPRSPYDSPGPSLIDIST